MGTKTKLLAALGAGILIAGGGVAIAQGVKGGDSDDVQATGPDAAKAKAAALKAVGGGRVVSVERETEAGSAWELEVVDNGKEVEASLDKDFKSLGVDRSDDANDDANEKDDADDGKDDADDGPNDANDSDDGGPDDD